METDELRSMVMIRHTAAIPAAAIELRGLVERAV
jgi:hypothetical protein